MDEDHHAAVGPGPEPTSQGEPVGGVQRDLLETGQLLPRLVLHVFRKGHARRPRHEVTLVDPARDEEQDTRDGGGDSSRE